MASEVGVLDIAPENVLAKGRLQPGRMFLVDIAGRPHHRRRGAEGGDRRPPTLRPLARREPDAASSTCRAASATPPEYDDAARLTRQQAFGYTIEDLRFLMSPMALNGQEAVGSMGTDTPLAVPVEQAAAPLQLLQAALRPGHEPADRPDPRGAGHVAQGDDRLRGEPLRGDARGTAASSRSRSR